MKFSSCKHNWCIKVNYTTADPEDFREILFIENKAELSAYEQAHVFLN